MVLGVEGLAGGVTDQLAGEVAAAVGVNLLAKPFQKRLVIPLLEAFLKAGQVAVGGLPELGSGEVSKRVGGEITEPSQGPMNILKATAGIVGHFEAQKFLEQIVPSGRQVFHLEVS